MTQLKFDLYGDDLELLVDPISDWDAAESKSLYMCLHSQPCTDAARAMIDALTATVGKEAGFSRKPTAKFRFAVGAMVADLFEAIGSNPPMVSERHMRSEKFSGQLVGHKAFMRVMKLMKQTGYIEVTDGIWFRRSADGAGRLTTIRPTTKLLSFALARGVTPARHVDHFFRLPRPQSIPDPVKLSRERKTLRGIKEPKSVMAIAKDDEQARAEGIRINRLNSYFARQVITPDRHFAFQRQFHDGDVEGFAWDRGGRLYSLGLKSYQQMSTRPRPGEILRSDILINGKQTVEIDINASHTRILHASAGVPLDPNVDPYIMAALPRGVVKDFVSMTLGYTRFQRAWSPRKKEWYADPENGGINLQKTYPIANVRESVLNHLPLLKKWESSPIRWQQLQYIESELLIECVEILAFEYDVPALPVHDSIIVPVESQVLAMNILTRCFEQNVGAVPMLKVKGNALADNDM